MDVMAAVGSNQQATTVVQPGEGALDDPAVASQAGSVRALTARDHRLDASPTDEPAVAVVIVGAVGDDHVGPPSRPSDAPPHRRHQVEQGEELRDVVAVAAGQRPGQRQAASVYEQMVLAAATAPVDGAWARLRAPFFACT